jgi:drug/metabolite transporter (DMT)-like permease
MHKENLFLYRYSTRVYCSNIRDASFSFCFRRKGRKEEFCSPSPGNGRRLSCNCPNGGFDTLEFFSDYFIGILSVLLAGGIYAVVIMNVRVLKRDHSEFAIAFWGTAISCLLMMPFAFEPSASVLVANIFPLIAFGVVSVGIGGILVTIGFANLKSQTGSLLALLEPVAGVFFDIAVLGVALSAGTIAGCLLVLAAAVIISFNDSSKPSVKCNDSTEIVENCGP